MGIPTVSLMTPAEAEDSALPSSETFAVVKLVSGERFPNDEFMEKTQAVLLGNGG